MPSTRRTLLASLGTVLTGCAGTTDGSGSTPTTPPPSPTATGDPSADRTAVAPGETVRVDGVRVTVSDPVVTHSIRYLTAPDALGVATAEDGQFVVLRVAVEGEGSSPPREAFTLRVDGDRHAPGVPTIGPSRVDAPVSGLRYGDGERRGYLAVRVPTPVDASSAAVVLDGAARWSLQSSTLDPLRSPPPAFATTLDLPDRVRADEPIPVRLEVTNEGGVAGVFRGAINHQGPLYGAAPFAVRVEAGETVRHEARIDYHVDESMPPERVQFGVVGPGLSGSHAVDVAGGGTPDGTTTAGGTATP